MQSEPCGRSDHCQLRVLTCRITHDYPIVAAEEFKKLGSASEPFRFVYMSGGGARQDGKAMQEWANVKGQTERDLKAMETDSFQVLSIRPGGIMPTPEVRLQASTSAR